MPDLPPHDFTARRARVLERLGGGAMVLPAAPVRYHSRDTEYPYRPDSELYYLTGLTEPGAVAVLRGHGDGGEDDPRFALFVRERDRKAERWSGPRLGPEAALEACGSEAAFPLGELEERLPGLLKGARGVHFRLGASPRTETLVVRSLEEARARGARKGLGPRRVVDPGVILDELRLRKEPSELARIRRAAAVTVEGFRAAAAEVGQGKGEWEVQAALEATFRRTGARGTSFATIAASGANACVLHYVANRDRLAEGDLVLVDAGAEVEYYAGDATRTFPVSGAFTPGQRQLYEIVDRARREAVEAVRPGATVEEVHRAAVEVLVEGLVTLGVLNGPVPDRIEDGSYRELYPHQTSHWLGLDTHDPGDYARDDEPRVLEAGMVLTVEPGLYFAPGMEGEELVGAAPFEGMGIRIEDDVLVTDEGREVLTAELPADADAVEAMVRRG